MRYRLPTLSLLFVLMAAAAFPARAYDYLRVLDPHGWRSSQGTIEQAVLSVRPQGLYMEYGLYLTFSARGGGFGAADQLEVEFHFDLPEGSIVTDSWLWVGEDIVRAQILDLWTASTIYEGIVQRRRDPSILMKRGPRSYELRVYPLLGSETRKVKLTFLVPAQWSEQAVTAPLPLNLLRTSRNAVPALHVLSWPGEEWKEPRLTGAEAAFVPDEDTQLGPFLKAVLPNPSGAGNPSFAVDAPLQDGVYLSRYDGAEESYYQLVLAPARALDLARPRKVAFLVDYDGANTALSREQVLDEVEAAVRAQRGPGDAFNVILSGLNVRRASETWLPGDDATVDAAFEALDAGALTTYSNLQALLADGMDFVEEAGEGGSLLLVSSADQFGDYQVANQLLDDLLSSSGFSGAVYVLDYQDQRVDYYFIGGRSYYGNGYFYTNLARRTAGEYVRRTSNDSFGSMMAELLPTIGGSIGSFDLFTALQSGFTFGRFTSIDANQSASLGAPLTQIGKFFGGGDFELRLSGLHEGAGFSRTIDVPQHLETPADSLLETAWVGRYIESLEARATGVRNEVVNEILDLSLKHRVLSEYSAFLALEPSETVPVCVTCEDESQLVAIEDPGSELPEDTLRIQAYPNPFRERTTIEVEVPAGSGGGAVAVHVYNVMGQVVRTLHDDAATPGTLRLTWDGTNAVGQDVASGVYFAVVVTPARRQSVKLVRLR